LEASAYLHDNGHFVSDVGHHKHSAYLVANSGLPGFTNKERSVIAALCRFHRKSLPYPAHPQFQTLDAESKRLVLNLAPLLRIADALDRGHEQKVQDIASVTKDSTVTLVVQAEQDANLEIWAANEAAIRFRELYPTAITVRRARALSATLR